MHHLERFVACFSSVPKVTSRSGFGRICGSHRLQLQKMRELAAQKAEEERRRAIQEAKEAKREKKEAARERRAAKAAAKAEKAAANAEQSAGTKGGRGRSQSRTR